MALRRNLISLVITGLLAASCGGGGDTDATAGSETPAGDVDDNSGEDGGSAEDQKIAENALLTLSDFPSGWQQKPAEEDEDEDDEEEEQQREIAECLGADYDDLYGNDGGGEADSPTFLGPDEEEISNSVGVSDSESRVTENYELLTSDKGVDCLTGTLADAMEKAIKDGGEAELDGEVTANRMSFGSYGDATTAFRVTVPVAAEGFSAEVYVDFVVVRIGRAIVTVNAVSLFDPFDSDTLADFTELAAERLTTALAA